MRALELFLIGVWLGVPLASQSTGTQAQYTGSKACAGCHRAIYDKFSKTGMGRSVTKPDPALANAPASVSNQALYREFRVYRQGQDLFQAESERKDGEAVFETVHKLEYAIGSGKNGISFVVRRGDHLFQAPLSYYTAPGRWGFSPGFEQTGEGFNRPIYEGCIVCHAGRPQIVPGREGQYRDPPFAEMAIGCENCHGPGELHVRQKGSGLRAARGTAIVNPAKLPSRLAEDICMQCHQGGTARVLLPGRQYSDFRPGTPLVRTLAIFDLPLDAKDKDLLEHHSSMKLSRCFSVSQGKLGCLSCHDPHEQPDAASAPAYFRAKCFGCHNERSCRLNAAARSRTAPPDNCIECHMPKRSVGQISHSSLTNHRIPVRPGAPLTVQAPEPVQTGLPGLVLLNGREGEPPLPLLTRLAAYGELMARDPGLAPRYAQLLEEARKSVPEDPLVLAALGRKALAENSPAAAELLVRAEQKGASSPGTYIDLSEALVRTGREAESAAALERGEQAFPYSRELRKHLILRYIREKAYAKARAALERYVSDFPEDAFMRGLRKQAQAGPRGTP